MNDDAIERLRRENPFPETLPAPAIGPLLSRLGDRGSGSRPRRHLALGRVLAAAGVAMAVAVAVLAVVLVGRGHPATTVAGHHGPSGPSGTPSQSTVASYINAAYERTVKRDPACGFNPPNALTAKVSDRAPSRALLSAFGVLRRPARASDRLPQSDYGGVRLRIVYVRYVRRARVVGSVSYYLVPAQVAPPPGAVPLRCFSERRAALQTLGVSLPATERAAIVRAGTEMLARERRARLALPTGPYDGVELVGLGPGGGGSCCVSAAMVPAQVSIGLSIGRTRTIASGVVPDSVASVSLYYAHTPSQNVPTIIAKATRTIVAPVVNDVYAVNFRNHGRSEPAAVVYRSANGAVISAFNTNQ